MPGLAHLCHHDMHWEYCYDFDARVKYIKNYKPKDEIEIRLKWFQLVPESEIPGKDSKAWDACVKAWDVCEKAWDAYVKAWDAYLDKYASELDKLHDTLFPGCPWNGETMFPEKGEGAECKDINAG